MQVLLNLNEDFEKELEEMLFRQASVGVIPKMAVPAIRDKVMILLKQKASPLYSHQVPNSSGDANAI